MACNTFAHLRNPIGSKRFEQAVIGAGVARHLHAHVGLGIACQQSEARNGDAGMRRHKPAHFRIAVACQLDEHVGFRFGPLRKRASRLFPTDGGHLFCRLSLTSEFLLTARIVKRIRQLGDGLEARGVIGGEPDAK